MPHDTTLIGDDTTADAAASTRPSHRDDFRSLEAGLDRLQTAPERPTNRWPVFVTSLPPPIPVVLPWPRVIGGNGKRVGFGGGLPRKIALLELEHFLLL